MIDSKVFQVMKKAYLLQNVLKRLKERRSPAYKVVVGILLGMKGKCPLEL